MSKDDYEVIGQGIADTSDAQRGSDICYRCTLCGGLVPSNPGDSVGCECGNVFIDFDYFRLAVRDCAAFEVLRRKTAPHTTRDTGTAS